MGVKVDQIVKGLDEDYECLFGPRDRFPVVLPQSPGNDAAQIPQVGAMVKVRPE